MSDFDPDAPATFDGIFGLPHTPEQARVVLIPVPWEPTTSYRRGTAKGPAAILAASRQVDLFDLDTGKPYQAGIAMLAADPEIVAWNAEACEASAPVIDAGGHVEGDEALTAALARVNDLSAKMNDRVHAIAKAHLDQDKIVGLVGGDHAAPFGNIRAHAEKYGPIGLLHVDAHADLRRAYEGFTFSHASIIDNVRRFIPGVEKIVQVGIRDLGEEEHDKIKRSKGKIVTYFDRDLAAAAHNGEPFARVAERIARALPDQVYVTFDIDGLDPSLCPNTGTPVPGGLSFREIVAILDAVVQAGKTIVGFDLNEVAPGSEGDEWDANVGARVLYKLIGFTLASR